MDRCSTHHRDLLVIINNFHVFRVVIGPFEVDTPLPIYANAQLV